MKHISLFTGIAGIDLAAEWAGFETILMVEKDGYCQKVLRKHWPDVPLIGDIKDVTKETIANSASYYGEFHGSNIRREEQTGMGCDSRDEGNNSSLPPVTLITGGFPCQPVSQAGKRRGKEDDRWLWPEMLRVISEVRPTWVVAENVIGLLTMGFHDCLSDLEGEGYEVQAFVIPACGVNAPHRRDRIFIVAWDPNGRNGNKGAKQEMGEGQDSQSPRVRTDVADTESQSSNGSYNHRRSRPRQVSELGNSDKEARPDSSWWSVEPDVGRVVARLSPKLDGGIDEVLRILWTKYGTTKMVKREIGQYLGEAKILLNQMLRRLDTLTEQGSTKEWSEASSKTVGKSSLREMWAYCWLTTASQGQESFEQQSGEPRSSMPGMPQERPPEGFNLGDYWLQEPNIPRVAKGVSNRVNRLKALGNAVVPQQIYPILKAIADIERGNYDQPRNNEATSR